MQFKSDDYIKRFEPIWGSWKIEELIGEGSYGRVYKIYKDDWGFKYQSALKHIEIPTKDQYKEATSSLDHRDESSLKEYFKDAVKNMVNEIRLMYTLRGTRNIICYEDHAVHEKEGEVGWDLLIRMEYAMPLTVYIKDNELTRQDLINLGIDMCHALEACSRVGIIHRDIKDDNIFVSGSGDYKLGDFGISRILSGSGRAASMKGTPFFMAPEVYRSTDYDIRSDIYSLGIVLYKLANHGRLPFMPPYPQKLKYHDSEKALDMRMSGEILNLPQLAGQAFGEVILKACSFNMDERFESSIEMRKALENVLEAMEDEEKNEVILFPKADGGGEESKADRGSEELKAKVDDEESKAHIDNEEPKHDGGNEESKADGANEELYDDFEEDPDKNPLNRTINLFGPALGTGKFLNERGNSLGNIVNGGIAAQQGLWVYYSNVGRGLYRSKLDGSDLEMLCEDSAWFINVIGNWIYYSNASDDDRLYKINIDGLERTRLNDDKTWDINVLEDWIYYCNESDGFKIYKIKTDGTCRIKLNNESSYSLNVENNWIYYSNKSDKGKIYKIRTDGANRTKINDNESDFLNVYNDWIYYSNKGDGFKLYRVGTFGGSDEMLNAGMCRNINVYGGWVYYVNKSENGKMCRLRTDGGTQETVAVYKGDFLNMVDEFVFFCNKSDGDKLYKIGTDGSSPEAVEVHDLPSSNDDWFSL